MIRLMTAAALLYSGAAYANQTVTSATENASTSAVIIEGSSASDTLKTHPDVSVAPVMTAPQSCRVGDFSVTVGSLLFGGIGGSKTKLDEHCQAIATSSHFANLGVTYATVFGDKDRGVLMMDNAVRRMYMNTDEWEAQQAWMLEEWEEFWNP